jgi:hypothetical protein
MNNLSLNNVDVSYIKFCLLMRKDRIKEVLSQPLTCGERSEYESELEQCEKLYKMI